MYFIRGNNKDLRNLFMEEMKKKMLLYPDIMMKYSIYETPEITIKNYTYQDWEDMRRQLVINHEVLLGREKPTDNSDNKGFNIYASRNTFESFIDIFKTVRFEDLKRFHENKIVFDITRYLIYARKRWGENYLYIDKECGLQSFPARLQHYTAKNNLDADDYDKDSDREKDNMIYWATYYIIKILNDSPDIKDIEDVVAYIIETLQYAKTEDLQKLVKLTAKKFDVKLRGRQPKGMPIYKFDVNDSHLICVYSNRKECIEKEGMTKSTLSKLFSQDLASWHKRVFIEMSEEQAKKENFEMERMLTRININKMREETK